MHSDEQGAGAGLQSVHMAEGAKFMPHYPSHYYSFTLELSLHLFVDLDSHRQDV